MYLSTIGKSLVQVYNDRHGTTHDCRSFFDEVYHPLFYDDNHYLMWATNSPFVQGKSSKSSWDAITRRERRDALHASLAEGEHDASIALGYPASEIKKYATTSGQVTDLVIPGNAEDAYASWIGASCGLGVQGGYNLVFDHPELLYATYEGWQMYRRYLDDPATMDKFPPNKITSWNGQWMLYRLDDGYRQTPTLSRMQEVSDIVLSDKSGSYEINTASWTRLVLAMSRYFEKEDMLHAYVFSLGQTNKTVGFLNVKLSAGKRLARVYKQLFDGGEYNIKPHEVETLYGSHIKRACELGSIGLQAMRPQDLQKYFKNPDKSYKLNPPSLKPKKNESEADYSARRTKAVDKDRAQLTQFYAFKTWIIAMLNRNKQEVSDLSRNFAQTLVAYRNRARKLDRKTTIEKHLLGATNQRAFLEGLSKISNDDSVEADTLKAANEMRDAAHFTSASDFGYFVTLLKFDYAYAERNSEAA